MSNFVPFVFGLVCGVVACDWGQREARLQRRLARQRKRYGGIHGFGPKP